MEAVDHKQLMAAVGRIAVRAAELGDIIDGITKQLRPDEPWRVRNRRMIGQKLHAAMAATREGKLGGNRGLAFEIICFCRQCLRLLPDRNSAVHSTYHLDTDRNEKITGIIMWDGRDEPQFVTVKALNEKAKQFHGAQSRAAHYLLEVRDYLATGIVSIRYVRDRR
jgi:hypothetical protein